MSHYNCSEVSPRGTLIWTRRAVVAVAVFCFAAAGLFLFRPTQAAAATSRSAPASSTVLPPSQDPFYTPNVPLGHLKPGTPIKVRTVRVITSQNKKTKKTTSIKGTQILYRTTDEFGRAAAAVTTIVGPATKGSRSKLISYHAPYDTLGSQCDPSYELQGSGQGTPQALDLVAVGPLLAQGYTVTIPDYEGLKQHWTIGAESAYAALDSVRASEKVLKMPASTPVGLMGYSGGSVPTGFAADLAPTYAPELHIVGAAAGGVLVDPAHNLGYINKTPLWSSVIPALMYSYNETYDLNIGQYLSADGTAALAHVAGQCLTEFLGKPGNIDDSDLLKQPQWPSLLSIPALIKPLNKNIMGASGVPHTPVFLGVGNVDGIGDGIMMQNDVAGLATQYCAEHVKTQYRIYPKKNHFQAFVPWTVDADAFINARFAGKSATYCQGIPPGTPLTPLK